MRIHEKLGAVLKQNQPPLSDLELAAQAGVVVNTVKAAKKGKASLQSMIAIGESMGLELQYTRPRRAK